MYHNKIQYVQLARVIFAADIALRNDTMQGFALSYHILAIESIQNQSMYSIFK